jgi:hypothetical protein
MTPTRQQLERGRISGSVAQWADRVKPSREERALIVIVVLSRRLREGKTYEDFREAWLPEQGFGLPARVVSAQRVDDDRESITIGFSELDEAEAEAQLQRIGPQEQRRHDKIDALAEPEMTRYFYVQVADDDFTDAPSREPSR